MHCAKTKDHAANCTCFDTFDKFLEYEFLGSDFGHYANKDNIEDLYPNWVCELGAEELIEYGEAYGSYLRNLVENGIPYQLPEENK